MENKLVNLIGRHDLNKGPLANLTNAGEGVSGTICSKKLKIKRSQNATGIKNPNYGNPNNFKHSKETKKAMSESRKGEKNPNYGKKYSLETKIKMSELKKDYIPWNKGKKCKFIAGKNNPMYGKKHSLESKEKIRRSNSKPVINTDGLVFESSKEAGKYYNLSPSGINKILKGKTKNKFGLSYYTKK